LTLKALNAGHGSTWLISIFEKMGENPNDPSYVKPKDGNVWDFISEIKEWISNERRDGIP
jgi:hypothetical protein